METRDVWPEAIFQASILPPTRGPASSLFLLQGQHTPFPLPEVLLLPSVSNRFSSHPLASVVKPLPHRTSSPGRLHLQKGLHSEGLSPESFLSDTLIQKSVLLMNSSSSEKASAQDRSLFKKISREERPPQRVFFKMATSSCLPLREATSSESLLGEGHLLLRRPHQKGLLRGFSQNVLLSERPLLCAFSSEKPSSSEKAASSSASSFFLLRRTSHQERFLSARLSLQDFSGKPDLRSLPLRGSPFRKDLLCRRLPSQEHLYRCSVFRFFFFFLVCVTFCSYFFARIYIYI